MKKKQYTRPQYTVCSISAFQMIAGSSGGVSIDPNQKTDGNLSRDDKWSWLDSKPNVFDNEW